MSNPTRSEEIDWGKVEGYIKKHFSLEGEMDVDPFAAGYSNLTYLIGFDGWRAVLRRPPFGKLPPKAHDMEREYRLLENIHPVFPEAPEPYLYCEDPEVMDKHFYIMEAKEGVSVDAAIPPEFKEETNIRKVLSETLISTLVRLHSIDIKTNNLLHLGKPEGYLERQVNGWIKRYRNAETDDLGGVKETEEWLIGNIPESPEATIVHNDFKLNNLLFKKENPQEVTGVLDWELCTIGDPLTDVASTLAYWTEEGEEETGLTSVTRESGFLKRRELLELYAKKSGKDVSDMDYYLSFAFYKIAAILQQIYFRWNEGHVTDDRFRDLDKGIRNLMDQAAKARKGQLL